MNIIDIRDVIESVVKEVVTSMNNEQSHHTDSKVLFVMHNENSNELLNDQMIELKNNQIDYDLLFIGEEAKSLSITDSHSEYKVINEDENPEILFELAKKYECIVLPEIDLDNAARVVTGMKGSMTSKIIYAVLLLERIIFINKNVKGIGQIEMNALNTVSLPETYKKLFDSYKEQLTELGIEFIDFNVLAHTILNRIKPERTAKEEVSKELESVRNGLTFTKKLITSEWIEAQTDIPNNKIYVSKKTIISPLAKDIMKERGLTITYID